MAMAYQTSPKGKAAIQKLNAQGFVLPEEPKDTPALPDDPSDLGGEDLLALFSLLSAWADYAEAQEGLAVIAEREAERELERAQAIFWDALPPKTAVTAAKALQVMSQDIVDAQEEVDEAYAYRRLLSDLTRRYERDANVISRELTRRSIEVGPRRSRRERWGSP